MEAFIKAKGLAAAQQYIVGQLKTVGVDEAAILAKADKAKVAELTIEDLVLLAADYKAIENGDANADEPFEIKAKTAAATDLKSKLKAQVESTPKAEAKPAMVGPHSSEITVKPGRMPFTYYMNSECTVCIGLLSFEPGVGVTTWKADHTRFECTWFIAKSYNSWKAITFGLQEDG
jgi:hypothetical protein